MTPLLAYLEIDGDIRQTCMGCAKKLFRLGMLRIVREASIPVNGSPPETYSAVFYEIAPPYTLKACQRIVQGEHVGPPSPWGSA